MARLRRGDRLGDWWTLEAVLGQFREHPERDRATIRAMSQENVKVVRRLFDTFARGDIDALLELCDPDIVLTQTPDVETLGVPRELRGHEGLLRAFAAWPEQWDDFQVELSRVVGDPGDQVVVATRQTGRGRQSGIEVEADYMFVFTVRDKITEWRVFERESDALEAAGLSD